MSASAILANLTAENLVPLVEDILVDELQATRGSRFDPATLTADAVANLDSMERISLASRVNEFFALYESGVEDYLLRARTTEEMARVVQRGLREFSRHITFRSGGSTGGARSVQHETILLEQETSALADLFRGRSRVILTVPSHHIYGFLFGILLPRCMDIPVVHVRRSLLGGPARPRAGDLVVSVPFLWERYVPAVASSAEDLWGVTSTAPFPLDKLPLRNGFMRGLDRFLEVYGSSETGGVGWRDLCFGGVRGDSVRGGPARDDSSPAPELAPAPFELFPFWRRHADTDALERLPPDNVETLPRTAAVWHLPDRIRWVSDRQFYPGGRHDEMVQVGGHNVDLQELGTRIRGIVTVPVVEDCAVRLDRETGRVRAFLVTDRDPSPQEEAATRTVLRRALRDHEIPGELVWGRVLPRSGMGKVAAW